MKDSLDELVDTNAPLEILDSTVEQSSNVEYTPTNTVYDALVLDAVLRQSLVTVRSLGRRGLRIAALDTSKSVPTFSSRWCQQRYCAPSYQQSPEPYLTFLERLLDRTAARVLITSSDGTLALIHRYRERLQRRVRIALANDPALGIAMNKEQTLEVAQRLGLGVPRSVNVGAVSEVKAALGEVGLPVVVKPVESWLWGEQQGARLACKLVTTPDEARSAVEELTRFGGTTLFQQFLSGRREAVSLLYARGEIYARFAQWASRTMPPLGGTSVLRQSIAVPPDIGDQAERLVREIDLEGYSEVEFRRDSNGKPYLMEINPRLSASIEIAVRAGVDFPYLLYQWANGDQIDVVKGYRLGIWIRHLGGDIITTLQALAQHGRPGVTPPHQAIADFFLSFARPMGYDYIDWKDPLPVYTAMAGFAGYAFRRLGRGLSRK